MNSARKTEEGGKISRQRGSQRDKVNLSKCESCGRRVSDLWTAYREFLGSGCWECLACLYGKRKTK